MSTKSINILKPHLAIKVKDVEVSTGFYRKLFNIEPSKVRTGYAKFDVQSPALNFTLNQAAFAEKGALSHLGIQVGTTEDVTAVKRRWIEAGLTPRDELQTSCCYALQDKAWVNDPDGNAWEVFTVIKDDLQETRGKVGEGPVCCTPSGGTDRDESAEKPTCACEASPPAENEPACCETQAAKFGIEVK